LRFLLLAVGAIPLFILEMVEVVRQPGGKERLSNDQKILLVASTAKSEAVLKRRPNDV
jgi:hypothetical protein